MRLRFLVTLFTICLVYTLPTMAQYDLGFKLKANDTYRIRQLAKQEITQEFEGMTQVLHNDLEGIFTYRVKEVTTTGYVILMTFEEFAMKVSSDMGEVMNVRASKKVEGDPMSTILHAIIGHEFELVMTTRGAIVASEGSDALITKMIVATGITDEVGVAMMRKTLEKEYGSDFVGSLEQMTFIYPDQAVSINESWHTHFSGKLTAQNTWVLEKVTNGIVSISGTANVEMTTINDTVTMNLKGAQETMIETSEETGFIDKMMISGSYEGSSLITQMGSTQIPTTITQTVTYEIIPD